MKYQGIIVEESLKDNRLLNEIEILSVRISSADAIEDRWHIYKVLVSKDEIEKIANELKTELWYMHFWHNDDVIAVFPKRFFEFKHSDSASWQEAIDYGKSLGIPESQLDFIIE